MTKNCPHGVSMRTFVPFGGLFITYRSSKGWRLLSRCKETRHSTPLSGAEASSLHASAVQTKHWRVTEGLKGWRRVQQTNGRGCSWLRQGSIKAKVRRKGKVITDEVWQGDGSILERDGPSEATGCGDAFCGLSWCWMTRGSNVGHHLQQKGLIYTS